MPPLTEIPSCTTSRQKEFFNILPPPLSPTYLKERETKKEKEKKKRRKEGRETLYDKM